MQKSKVRWSTVQTMSLLNSVVIAAAIGTVGGAIPQASWAATYNWTGGGGTAVWSNAANWTVSGGSTHAVPGSGDLASFPTNFANLASATLGGTQSVAGLSLGSGVTLNTTDANGLFLGSQGMSIVSAHYTTAGNVALNASQIWTLSGTSSTATIGGAVGFGGNTLTASIATGCTLAFNNSVTTGSLTQMGPGTVIVAGTTSFTSTLINGGNFQIGNGGTGGVLTGSIINNANVTFNRSNTVTYAGAISGSGTVTQTGSGLLILSGTNSNTGGLVVSGGTLQLGSDLAFSTFKNVAVAQGTLDLDGHATSVTNLTLGNGSATGAKSVINSGASVMLSVLGKISFVGANTDQAALVKVPINLSAGTHLIDNPNGQHSASNYDIVFSAPITGVGGITKSGFVSSVALTATSSYSGATQIDGGRLIIGIDNALPTSTDLILSGSAVFGDGLYLAPEANADGVTASNGHFQTVGSLSGTGGVFLGTGSLTVNQSSTTTFAGTITGQGGVVKSGGGTLKFSGSNNYTGGTYLAGGTLQAGSAFGIPSGGYFTVAQGSLDLNGNNVTVGDLQVGDGVSTGAKGVANTGAAASLKVNGGIHFNGTTLDAPGLFQVPVVLSAGIHDIDNPNNVFSGASYDVVFSSPISGDGGINVLTDGQLYVALASANSYTGGTTLGGSGRLYLTATNALPTTGALTVNGATLALNPSVTENGVIAGNYNQTVGSLAGTGGGIDLGTATLTVNQSGDTTFSGRILGTSGNLVKSGDGNLTLSGSNTYGGTTTINGGVIIGGVTNALPVTTSLVTNGAFYGPGGTGQTVAALSGTGGGVGLAVGMTLTVNQFVDTIYGGTIYDATLFGGASDGSLVKQGTGKLTLLGDIFLGGTVTSSGGTLQVGNGGAAGSIKTNVINSAGLTFNRSDTVTFSRNITGSGTLTQAGSGVLILTGSQPLTNSLNVANGIVKLASTTANVSVLPSLAIQNDGAALGLRTYSAQLDVTTNDLIIRDGSIASVSDMARAGQNGVTLFEGNGITSSVAAADANGLLRFAVGVVQNNIDGSTLYDNFDGVTVGLTDVLVKFTYFGDADLNGFIDDTDFFLTNNGYALGLSGWVNGDFDYSGTVDDTDFFLINNAYALQGAVLRAETGGSVPEPTGAGLMGLLVGSGLMARRRR